MTITNDTLREFAGSDSLTLAITSRLGSPSFADIKAMAAELLAARDQLLCKGCGGTVGDHLAPDQGGCPARFEIDGVSMVPMAGCDLAVREREAICEAHRIVIDERDAALADAVRQRKAHDLADEQYRQAKAERDRLRAQLEHVASQLRAAWLKREDSPISSQAHFDEAIMALILGAPEKLSPGAHALRETVWQEIGDVNRLRAEIDEVKESRDELRAELAELARAAEELISMLLDDIGDEIGTSRRNTAYASHEMARWKAALAARKGAK